MNLYTDLAHAKDELRRAKDHENTMRAIAEYIELSGKNPDDRKRELAFTLCQDKGYRKAQEQLRDAEEAVDQAQATIDTAESERREHEWQVRARLADALREHTKEPDDFDGPTIDQITKAIQDIAQSRGTYAGVAREMLDAYNSGMADRINGAGEFEEDDEADSDPEANYQADMHAERYSSGFDATRRRMVAQREIDDLYK